jgi:hypothetical protein
MGLFGKRGDDATKFGFVWYLRINRLTSSRQIHVFPASSQIPRAYPQVGAFRLLL